MFYYQKVTSGTVMEVNLFGQSGPRMNQITNTMDTKQIVRSPLKLGSRMLFVIMHGNLFVREVSGLFILIHLWIKTVLF